MVKIKCIKSFTMEGESELMATKGKTYDYKSSPPGGWFINNLDEEHAVFKDFFDEHFIVV